MMLLNQKKKIEIERNMENNKQKWSLLFFLPELLTFIIALGEIYFLGYFIQKEPEQLMRAFVMVTLGIGIVGFLIRQNYLNNSLEYDNDKNIFRFWGIFNVCLIIAGVCVFIPAEGWPFMVIFITLSLFSNMTVGVASGSVLLMLTALLGSADISIFMLYFMSGIMAAAFFQKLDHNFEIAIPIWLSILTFLVCEIANIVLFANQKLNFELFVIPIANVIISSILLLGILKIFSSWVIYKYRVKYMEITDPECELLTTFKEEAKQEYYQCMHTAYFCDRIARKLELDFDAVKTAGYYHKIGSILESPNDFEEVNQIFIEQEFPPKSRQILEEYLSKDIPITSRETAVLLFADAVTATIMYVFSQEKEGKIEIQDYDKLIETVFRKRLESKILIHWKISMQEITLMKKIFKEEKLYYDFLR